MTRVLAVSDDLLFGSRVQAQLQAAGHEVTLAAALEPAVLAGDPPQVVVCDLELADASQLGALRAAGARTLAYYSHVDAQAPARARAAGFDLAVPRSRLAREGAELVTRLA